jgi:hypothetical protein
VAAAAPPRSLPRWTAWLPAALVFLAAAAVLAHRGVSDSGGGTATNPPATDYVDISEVPVDSTAVRPLPGASTGTWQSVCGRNTQDHHNTDNAVGFPGRPGAAHHVHDYVGNTTTNAFSTNRSLLAGGTTCRDADRSAYSWPVLRLPDQPGEAANQDRLDDNDGRILVPASVRLEYRGSPTGNVIAMPEFLRAVTGNAHGQTQGGRNTQHVQWSCSGERNRVTQRYPRCPAGQLVVRIFDFPSCWDARTTEAPGDLVFPDATATCPAGTFAVPQLHEEISYDVPTGARYDIDTFSSERHSPLADHADYIEVMPPSLMQHVVACLNEGRHC